MSTKLTGYRWPTAGGTGASISTDVDPEARTLSFAKSVDEELLVPTTLKPDREQNATALSTRQTVDRGTRESRPGSHAGDDKSYRRLLCRADVLDVLQLTEEKVDHLVATRQLTPFRLAGEERYDSRDLDRLIDTYITTASRRA
jgi:hypothetical protein